MKTPVELVDKFYDALPLTNRFESVAKECAEIADAYVKEVLEWLTNEKSEFSIMYGNQEKRFATKDKDFTIEEFLEIHKKKKL